MHPKLAKYLFYYPTVFAKGELVPLFAREYETSQKLSLDDVRKLQITRTKRILDYGVHASKFYRQLYQSIDIASLGDTIDLDVFKTYPTVSKQDLIDSKDNIYTFRRWYSATKTTGGSTGEPVQLKKNPEALARERAATWRSYKWAGIDIGDPQARFWGVPHSLAGRLKMHVVDFISNRRRVSAFDLSEADLYEHYQMLRRLVPRYVYGYVSAIYLLARFIQDNKLHKIPSIKAVITTAEILPDASRKEIASAFACKVFNEYGCGEVGSIAHECEHGSMHIMAENLLVEVDAAPGESGELIVTDFFNRATPLIRYRLGDYATLDEEPCGCGRGLPVLSGIHGRAYDLIRTPSGRVIHPESLIYVFEAVQESTGSMLQFQAVQTLPNFMTINIVPADNWSEVIRLELERRLTACLGKDVEFEFIVCGSITRERSGKMRLVKSLIH